MTLKTYLDCSYAVDLLRTLDYCSALPGVTICFLTFNINHVGIPFIELFTGPTEKNGFTNIFYRTKPGQDFFSELAERVNAALPKNHEGVFDQGGRYRYTTKKIKVDYFLLFLPTYANVTRYKLRLLVD